MPQRRKYRKRPRGSIPFGWTIDEENSDQLIAVPEEQEALEKAYRFIDSNKYSSRSTAEWVTQKTGRYISHIGLLKAIKRHRKELKENGKSDSRT